MPASEVNAFASLNSVLLTSPRLSVTAIAPASCPAQATPVG
jgi:hypothetical protein